MLDVLAPDDDAARILQYHKIVSMPTATAQTPWVHSSFLNTRQIVLFSAGTSK